MGAPRTDRFTIRRQLGEGGMGVVYEAFDKERREPVALKTLSQVDPESLARFKREFRAIQGVAHPNLVTLGELFSETDQCFFTMELIDGVDLVTHVRGKPSTRNLVPVRDSAGRLAIGASSRDGGWGAFDEAKLRAGLRQLLEALAALHAADKVHRDVKPSNAIVTHDGRLVLLDFGLVTEPSADDSDAAVVGTPAYMAPEQAASLDVGPPADLYAVGVILYELLTGRLPIDGAHLQILLEKQTREPPSPGSIASGVPEDLDALCMKLLRFDPFRRPTALDALRSLANARVRGSLAPPNTTEAPASVGRATELAELRAAFDATTKGGLAVVFVCGESGIGKSNLTHRFAARVLADRPDTLLLEGRCFEGETVPFKALDGLVEALSRRLARMRDEDVATLLPAGSAVLAQVFPAMLGVARVAKDHASSALTFEPHELRRLGFLALRALLIRVAAGRPLVVTIDDLQWADDDGLRALGEILRPPGAPSLLLVGTVRTGSQQDADVLERLRATMPGGLRVVNVTGLSRDEARQLVTGVLQKVDAPDVDPESIVEAAGGHPLFLEELARHVARGGMAGEGVKLDDAICARVALLEPKTRSLVEIAAVAAKPTQDDVVASAAHFEPNEFKRRAATLRVSSLVRMGGARWTDAIEPYHDRVREAVLSRLTPERRRELHEALAIAFEASSSKDAETLATHWSGAGNATRAAKYAIAAGDEAAKVLAFERAADWYGRALELMPSDELGRRELRVKLGDALVRAGRGALAAPHFVAAAESSPPMQALDLRRRAAEELLTAGHFDEGDRVLEKVLAEVGIDLPRTPLAALAGLLFFRVLLFLRGFRFRERGRDEIPAHALARLEACNGVGRVLAGIDNLRGAYFQTRTLLAALALGEPKYVAHALSMEALWVATAGNGSRAAVLSDRARTISERTQSLELSALIEATSGVQAFVLGRFAEGLARSDRSAEILREHFPESLWELRAARVGAVWSVGWMGNLNELAERVERGVREADYRGDLNLGMMLRTGVPNLAWLRKGDVASARAVALDAKRRWTQPGYHSLHYWNLMAQTRLELYEGDGRAAYLRISDEWSPLTRSLVLQVRIMEAEAVHLRASAALAAAVLERGGERARMIRAAERNARRLERMRWPLAASFAHVARAGAAALRSDDVRAAKELDASARGFDAHVMSLHAMSAKWHLGRLRGGDEGRQLVLQAEAWMTEHGVADVASIARMLAPGFRQ